MSRLPKLRDRYLQASQHLGRFIDSHAAQLTRLSSAPIESEPVYSGPIPRPLTANIGSTLEDQQMPRTRPSSAANVARVKRAAKAVKAAVKQETKLIKLERKVASAPRPARRAVAVGAPVASGSGLVRGAPSTGATANFFRKESIDKDGNAIITGSDYIAPLKITSTTNVVGGVLYEYRLNPTSPLTLALQQYAQLYQKFEFLEVVLCYDTATPFTVPGSIGVLMDADPADIDGVGSVLVRQAATTRGSHVTQLFNSSCWVWNAKVDAAGEYYCSLDSSSDSGKRLTEQSHFVVHVVTPTSASLLPLDIGSLTLRYRVRFYHRQVAAISSSSPMTWAKWASDATGVFAGALTSSSNFSNFVSSFVVTGCVAANASGSLLLTFRAIGTYMVSATCRAPLSAAAATTQAIQTWGVTSATLLDNGPAQIAPFLTGNTTQHFSSWVLLDVLAPGAQLSWNLAFVTANGTMAASPSTYNFVLYVGQVFNDPLASVGKLDTKNRSLCTDVNFLPRPAAEAMPLCSPSALCTGASAAAAAPTCVAQPPLNSRSVFVRT